MADLFKRDGTAARTLRFTMLTAARAGEVFGMTRGEVNLTAELWTIPGERMKGGRQHHVPLSKQTLSILGEAIGDAVLGRPRSGTYSRATSPAGRSPTWRCWN